MFRRHIILSIAVCLWPVASLWAQAVSPTPAEMAVAQQWSKKLVNLPQREDSDKAFSFDYAGRPFPEGFTRQPGNAEVWAHASGLTVTVESTCAFG